MEREIYASDALGRVLDLPVVRGSDHAEGIDTIETADGPRMMVAYDSPRETRKDTQEQRLAVDLFAISRAGARG